MNWFRNFMQGRNGSDQLNLFLVVCAFALWIVEIFVPSLALSIIVWALLIWSIVRMFSRNVTARRNENYKFCTWLYRVRGFFHGLPARLEDARSHKRFRCPNCHQKVRVPRGVGRVKVTCPRCGEKFERRT